MLLQNVNEGYGVHIDSDGFRMSHPEHHDHPLAQDRDSIPRLLFSVVGTTVKTVATEIQPPKSTEIKSIHVAFQTDLDRRPFSVAETV